MWTFTAYIIWRLSQAKRSDRIYVSELVHFIFDILWRKYKVVLNTNSEELEREIEFLDEIGAVDFNDYEIRIKLDRNNSAAASLRADAVGWRVTYLGSSERGVSRWVEQ